METDEKKVPMRRCVGCMQSKPKASLIRIVDGPEGPRKDIDGKAQQRGYYLCSSESCLAKAIKKKKLPKDFVL